MNEETFFRLATVVVLGLMFSISIYFRHKADQKGGKLDPSGNKLLIFLRLLALVGCLPLILYLINPAWVSWGRVLLPSAVRWAAVGLAVAMLPLMFKSIGNNISPSHTTRQGHQLVTSGPYRWIRHPLYTFGLVAMTCLVVFTGLWSLGLFLAAAFVVLMWRVPKEEANLIATFGDEYRQYMARTGRFIPRFW
jgi:protein-S-isoprenylcysteine O-methyltransferase Ste14